MPHVATPRRTISAKGIGPRPRLVGVLAGSDDGASPSS